MSVVFETPRLVLREMTLGDLPFVAAMLADPLVMRFYPKCYSLAESESWILRQLDRYATHGYGLWLAIEKDGRRPVGQVGLLPQRVEGVAAPDIAYMIDSSCWRRGFGGEAAAGTRDYAFDVLDLPRVVSLIRPENHPSRGVALKVGMRPLEQTVMHAGFMHLIYAQDHPEGGEKHA